MSTSIISDGVLSGLANAATYGDGVSNYGDGVSSYGDGVSSYGDGISEHSVGSHVPLGDEIMLLEGGPSGLDGAALGEAPVCGCGMNPCQRTACLRKLLSQRRHVICRVRTEREVLFARLVQLDDVITRQLVPAWKVAIRRRDETSAAVLEAKVQKYDTLRHVIAVRVERMAKTEALAQVLTKNARCQLSLSALAEAARRRGRPNDAKRLLAAAAAVGKHTEAVKHTRQKQIAKWRASTRAQKVLIGKAMLRVAKAQTAQINNLPPSAARTAMLRTQVAVQKRVTAAIAKATFQASGAHRPCAAPTLPGINKLRFEGLKGLEGTGSFGEVLVDLTGLEGLFGAFKKIADVGSSSIRRDGSAIVNGNKKMAHMAEAAVRRVGRTVEKVTRSSACAVGGLGLTLAAQSSMTLKEFKAKEPDNFALWNRKRYTPGRQGTFPVYTGMLPFKTFHDNGKLYGLYYSASRKLRWDAAIKPSLIEKIGDAVEDGLKWLKDKLGEAICNALNDPEKIKAAALATGHPETAGVANAIAQRLASGCKKGSAPPLPPTPAPEKKSVLPFVVAGGAAAALLLLI